MKLRLSNGAFSFSTETIYCVDPECTCGEEGPSFNLKIGSEILVQHISRRLINKDVQNKKATNSCLMEQTILSSIVVCGVLSEWVFRKIRRREPRQE